MLLKQFYLGCLAHASYLVADRASKKAAVVDPQRDVEQYLAEAKKLGVKIEHVLLTHFHADFVAGHLELQKATGATIHLGARARAAYRFSPLSDGDEIVLGSVRLKALETPGHTPEGVCYLVSDEAAPGKPMAVLTGDTLFIGDVGRPDLMASVGASAKTLAGQLYDSLRGKLMTLPDDTLVYPAHGAGSLCGKNLSSDTVSTIGQQKKFNYALKPMTKARFVKLVTADQPAAPEYFAYDAALNQRKHPTLDAASRRGLKKLKTSQALSRWEARAQFLDTRDPGEFAAGHLAGSLNVGLGGKFASFAGQVLDPSKPIVLVVGKGREEESFLRLARIGFEKSVIGFVPFESIPAASLVSLKRYSPAELRAALKSVSVLDVRTPGERAASAIPGSKHVPLMELRRRLKDVPKGPLVVTCAGGYRSMMAASLLEAAGRTGVSDLEGGMSAWSEMPAACAAK